MNIGTLSFFKALHLVYGPNLYFRFLNVLFSHFFEIETELHWYYMFLSFILCNAPLQKWKKVFLHYSVNLNIACLLDFNAYFICQSYLGRVFGNVFVL